ncbi:hypothetical protein [Kribbella sp.]|uniref:hypothetical protein n=1 Tax=Kribbella sp. TaxID=1871183 RepID=UPI002D33BBA7|nr:hypothetical protein [Kribbella sp.]HZX07488.1 hypothetical protein [Kribbella sp.]
MVDNNGRTAQILQALEEADTALRRVLTDPQFDPQLQQQVKATDRAFESAADVARYERDGGQEIPRGLVHAQQESHRHMDRIASNLGQLGRDLAGSTLAGLQASTAKLRTALGGVQDESLRKQVEHVKLIVEGAEKNVQGVADQVEGARRVASGFDRNLPALRSGQIATTVRSTSDGIRDRLLDANRGMAEARTAVADNLKYVDAARQAAPGLIEKAELAKSMQAATNPTPQTRRTVVDQARPQVTRPGTDVGVQR